LISQVGNFHDVEIIDQILAVMKRKRLKVMSRRRSLEFRRDFDFLPKNIAEGSTAESRSIDHVAEDNVGDAQPANELFVEVGAVWEEWKLFGRSLM
jgi:hypothetical protein